ncbi:ArsR/SmtB family transcription factor [Pyxidicoccus trucidator]|uniref:ArsR/SmtB family transcription factor n=1 Tax=Pyxidicoccus trucidator TaxID=2709662 RepID=UPI0013DB5184|nr:metalloregulator ArsR/SmtB family transcription factor [Pyxidicoccus trucidator]
MATPAFQLPDLACAEHRAKVFKALSDPCRIRVVEMLAERGDMCGIELAQALGVSGALLSHHGKVLEAAGIISKRKDGPHAYCVLNRELLTKAFRGLVD